MQLVVVMVGTVAMVIEGRRDEVDMIAEKVGRVEMRMSKWSKWGRYIRDVLEILVSCNRNECRWYRVVRMDIE